MISFALSDHAGAISVEPSHEDCGDSSDAVEATLLVSQVSRNGPTDIAPAWSLLETFGIMQTCIGLTKLASFQLVN